MALQILKEKKAIIKKLTDMGEIIEELKNTEEFNQCTINKFFSEMFNINMSRKDLISFENEYMSLKSNEWSYICIYFSNGKTINQNQTQRVYGRKNRIKWPQLSIIHRSPW